MAANKTTLRAAYLHNDLLRQSPALSDSVVRRSGNPEDYTQPMSS
jgi:hypothetical protein